MTHIVLEVNIIWKTFFIYLCNNWCK